jgi:type I restriction enzyme S subunit
MTSKQKLLVDEFDVWSSADSEIRLGRGKQPGDFIACYGVRKIKELILNLAFCGKLVEQDDAEGSAIQMQEIMQMYQRIKSEASKSKKNIDIAIVSADEKYFDVPKNWIWTRLGETGKIFNGNSINESEKLEKYSNLDSGFPFIATKDVGHGDCELDYQNGVLIPFDQDKFRVAHAGAVLICSEGGSAGKKIGISKRDICFGNKLLANEVWNCISPKYIFYLYQSGKFFKEFEKRMTGIIGGISLNQFLSIPVPIPPYKEQLRIVLKLDGLMALCDELEERESELNLTHEKMVYGALDQLLGSKNEIDFHENWLQIVKYFDLIFNSDVSIELLKEALHQLAITGKLTTQNPSDSPAIELLNSSKSLQERKLPLPNQWIEATLDEFAVKITDGEHFRPQTQDTGVYFLSAKDIRDEGVSLDNPLYISAETAEKALKRCNPEYGDVLIVSRGATVGRSCKVDVHEIFCLLGSVILVKPNRVLGDYLVLALKSPLIKKMLINASGSTAQPAIYLKDLKKIVFPIPPLEEQRRIVQKMDELNSSCDQLQSKIRQLSQLKRKIADVLVERALT